MLGYLLTILDQPTLWLRSVEFTVYAPWEGGESNDGPTGRVCVPRSLFGGHAPRLRSVTLNNVWLPQDAVEVFLTATRLDISGPAEVILARLDLHFPSVSSLGFALRDGTVGAIKSSEVLPATKLRTIDFHPYDQTITITNDLVDVIRLIAPYTRIIRPDILSSFQEQGRSSSILCRRGSQTKDCETSHSKLASQIPGSRFVWETTPVHGGSSNSQLEQA
jgi:hypothetical protein